MIEWKCGTCGKSLTGEEGYIELPGNHAERERKRIEEDKTVGRDVPGLRVLTGTELVSLTRRTPWQVRCAKHSDPNSPYSIPVGQIKTPEEVYEWTAHLLEKTWVRDHTDWGGFLRKLATTKNP